MRAPGADPVLDPDPDLGTDLNLGTNPDLVSTLILSLTFSLTLAVSMAANNGQRPALLRPAYFSLQILQISRETETFIFVL